MRRGSALVGTAVFFVLAPGTVAGLIPWWITGWRLAPPSSAAAWVRIVAGGLIVLLALVVLVRNFARFVSEGAGTPAPPAPTERLVVGGDYRYVRNPMYLAVVGAVLGQALLFASLALLGYGLGLWAVVAAFVRWYEEPALARRHGATYAAYCAQVRAWLPRRTPWDG